MHNPKYRVGFADDLKKSLPKIPLPDGREDFWAYSKAGRELAKLHLEYESVEPLQEVIVRGLPEKQNESGFLRVAEPTAGSWFEFTPTLTERLRVDKMSYAAKGCKDVINVNPYITVENIPARAYEYIVNGKPAVEWVMERCQVKADKSSGIVNDPNLYSKETGQPTYILDLLLSVIAVSVKTMCIIDTLPELKW